MDEIVQLFPKCQLIQFILEDPSQPVSHVSGAPNPHVPQSLPPVWVVQGGVTVLAEGVVLDGTRRDPPQLLLHPLQGTGR